MANRSNSHSIEDLGIDTFSLILNKNFKNNIQFTRNIAREYGIDGEIELFENGNVTGKFAKLQIKSKEKSIEPLVRTPDFISCNKISISNYNYAKCNNALIILLYVSIEDNIFYFINMNEAVLNDKIKEKEDGYITVHIPVRNNSKDNISELVNIINNYWNKK